MNVAILGTGNMGRALIGGLIREFGSSVSIVAHDQRSDALAGLDPSVKRLSPGDWFGTGWSPDAVVVAVKPADVARSLTELRPVVTASNADPLWISIAAGVSLASLEKNLFPKSRVCRVMPNTPALIGEGMSAFAVNQNCRTDDNAIVGKIFGACGKTVAVPEKMMDAVTGLSGSGPAYVYLFIDSLIEGGVTAGLPYAVAKECALQTVIGAARMVQQSTDAPGVLKANVMSPGGTTACGLLALEKQAFRHAVISAVVEATRRSEQLGA